MTVAALGQRQVQFRLGHARLGQFRLHPAVQHGDDRSDHFQVAQFLGRDIQQHVLAAGILLGQALGEIAHGGGLTQSLG